MRVMRELAQKLPGHQKNKGVYELSNVKNVCNFFLSRQPALVLALMHCPRDGKIVTVLIDDKSILDE